MQKPKKFNHWKDEYEYHAATTSRSLSRLTEEELLKKVQNRHFDTYFSIWQVLRRKGTLKNCAPAMLKVLREEVGKRNMLQRYHCAGALFALMGEKEAPLSDLRKRVQWDHQGEEARQAAVDELEEHIKKILAEQ